MFVAAAPVQLMVRPTTKELVRNKLSSLNDVVLGRTELSLLRANIISVITVTIWEIDQTRDPRGSDQQTYNIQQANIVKNKTLQYYNSTLTEKEGWLLEESTVPFWVVNDVLKWPVPE